MNPRRLLNLLMALIVAAGFLSVPFGGPAVAKTPNMAVAGFELQAVDGGMPCCPDEGKARGCDSCPLMALCALTMPMPEPSDIATAAPGTTAEAAFAFPDDLLIDGLSVRPPDHPPRSRV